MADSEGRARQQVKPPRDGGATFSFWNRLERLLWAACWTLLGYYSPRPAFRWRRFLLSLFGAKLHSTARVYPGVTVWLPRNLEMGPYSCMASGVNCYCMARVCLAERALVSQEAFLCGGTHDINSPDFPLRVGAIQLHAHSWVGARAFVGPGVTVHDGAVLGACAVAFKDLAPWTVYVGNPATRVRARQSRSGVADER